MNAQTIAPVTPRRALSDPSSPGAKYRARLDIYDRTAREHLTNLADPDHAPVVLAYWRGMSIIARRRHQRDLIERWLIARGYTVGAPEWEGMAN